MKKILSIVLCLAMILSLAAVASAAETYGLVTDASKLANGQQIVILNNDFTKAMSVQSDNGKFRTDMDAVTNDTHSTVNYADGMAVITLEKNGDNYALKVGGQYLVCVNDGNNLKMQDAPAYWSISINEGGMATIRCVDCNERVIQYNAGSPRFATYKGTQADVAIYVKGYAGDVPVAAPTDPKQIVDLAFALAEGAKMPYPVTLTGKITGIDKAYDPNQKNISVYIEVEGTNGVKSLLCYGIKGNGAETLAVGDTITVTGVITNYKGTIEFGSGSSLDAVVPGTTPNPNPNPNPNPDPVIPTDPKQIVDQAFALAAGAQLPYTATLTGKVTAITDPYNEQYKNITLTIEVEGTDGVKSLVCYRIKGEAAPTVAVGDTITVTGVIVNYNGTIEFNTGSSLDSVVPGIAPNPPAPPADTGDSISIFVALMAVSAMGIAVISKKKF